MKKQRKREGNLDNMTLWGQVVMACVQLRSAIANADMLECDYATRWRRDHLRDQLSGVVVWLVEVAIAEHMHALLSMSPIQVDGLELKPDRELTQHWARLLIEHQDLLNSMSESPGEIGDIPF